MKLFYRHIGPGDFDPSDCALESCILHIVDRILRNNYSSTQLKESKVQTEKERKERKVERD
jgi:hypothetical protein